MKHFIYILISLFIVCSTAANSFGQKKKSGDAFAAKSKKGPNIYSSKPPRGKSKSKLYGHSVSKKRLKKKSRSGFSSRKKRYKSVNSKPSKASKGAPNSSGGRKSGKGRKKEK